MGSPLEAVKSTATVKFSCVLQKKHNEAVLILVILFFVQLMPSIIPFVKWCIQDKGAKCKEINILGNLLTRLVYSLGMYALL